jgi:hypothetical protein
MSENAQFGLLKLLNENVVELKFRRRHKKQGHPDHRRMFCTNSKPVLNSIVGKATLHYEPPTLPYPYGLPYIPSKKNLVVTWDILMCAYRQIPIESVEIIEVHPVKNKKEIEEFWTFFMNVVHPMSAVHKQRFMDR